MDYKEAHEKSLHIFQFKCNCSRNTWWGSNANNKCKRCGKTVEKLELEQTIGIGWFDCSCGRQYAGFSRGNVTSKCHKCQAENYPSFIVPGDEAENKNKKDKKAHYCAICKGSYNCPIVAEAKKERRF